MGNAERLDNFVTKSGSGLTEKQRRFVEAYLGEANGNGTEAAAIAGYGDDRKTLSVIAAQNLKKPVIRAAIDARTNDDGTIATREERQRFLTQIMRTEHRRVNERLKAVELLCRMHGDFIEKHTVDMTVSRKQQREELSNFLSQLSDRASDTQLEAGSSGSSVAGIIDIVSRSVAEESPEEKEQHESLLLSE